MSVIRITHYIFITMLRNFVSKFQLLEYDDLYLILMYSLLLKIENLTLELFKIIYSSPNKINNP